MTVCICLNVQQINSSSKKMFNFYHLYHRNTVFLLFLNYFHCLCLVPTEDDTGGNCKDRSTIKSCLMTLNI